jgi:predicted dehydrogenase
VEKWKNPTYDSYIGLHYPPIIIYNQLKHFDIHPLKCSHQCNEFFESHKIQILSKIKTQFALVTNPSTKLTNSGILGAANIAPAAIIYPAYKLKNVQVVAVAARNQEKAKQFAQKYNIPTVHKSYQDLLNDPNIDAIYNPLPNGLHHKWTCEALKCGKHVLCEKPFASNAEECEEMKNCAEKYGKSLVEAVHWRYHPIASKMKKILTNGELGNVKEVSVEVKFPKLLTSFAFSQDDIRWKFELAGGACMDAGFYVVNAIRFVAGKGISFTSYTHKKRANQSELRESNSESSTSR